MWCLQIQHVVFQAERQRSRTFHRGFQVNVAFLLGRFEDAERNVQHMARQLAACPVRTSRLDCISHVGYAHAASFLGIRMGMRDLFRLPVRELDGYGASEEVRIRNVQNAFRAVHFQPRRIAERLFGRL